MYQAAKGELALRMNGRTPHQKLKDFRNKKMAWTANSWT
jgi:hypothetical protein